MSLWAFRFLLWYICIMIVQPQNRFLFLYPLRIANLSMLLAIALHVFSCLIERRSVIRLGPATVVGIILLLAAFLSLYTGPFQAGSGWNPYIDMLAKNIVVLVMIEAMVYSVQRAWAVVGAMLFSTIWWIKGGLRLASSGMVHGGDRLFGPSVSLVVNPNAFAYMMCVFIPLYLYFYKRAPNKYVGWGFLALALSAVYITFRTGSRTGFLQLLILGLVLVPKYGRQHKVAFVVAVSASLFFFTVAGALNVQRFKTIPNSIRAFFTGEVREDGELSQDDQSAQERRLKNRDAWALIKDHPIFGAGINAADWLVVEKYPYAAGQVHCEILMAGRQMGYIGMGLYLALLAVLVQSARKTQASCVGWWDAVADLGWTFKIQAVMFIVGGAFAPSVWHPILLILVGTSSALWSSAREATVLAAAGRGSPVSSLHAASLPADA